MTKPALAIAALVACTGSAIAGPVNVSITADNHYSIYSRAGSDFTHIGANEPGPDGAPGTYNWSQAETWNFDAEGYLYIASWSDNSVAQGLLAEITTLTETILSGDPRWEVMSTGLDLGDWDAAPTPGDIAAWVFDADANGLWETPHVGGTNGIEPWSTIAGISVDARWMWRGSQSVADPLQGGADHGELLIFRIPVSVPAPGPLALAGLGGLMLARRRR